MKVLDIILDILRFFAIVLISIFAVLMLMLWIDITITTNKKVKENNYLLKELCVKQGINADSIISQMNNDTIQVNIEVKGPNE
jgi:cell division protein YceG involved in septum cleavage